MLRSLTLMLTSMLALSACIARDANPDDDPADATVTEDGGLDAWVVDAALVYDAAPVYDAAQIYDAARPPDAGRDALCARSRTPDACADADCTWRGDACVDLAECATAMQPRTCDRAGCVLAADDRCLEPDDPTRCAETNDATLCTRRQCFWRRAQGEDGVGCHPDPTPSLQDCAQPEAGICEAAGCEWTGLGCAPPNQTPCGQLEDDACEARTECLLSAAGCMIDPAAACDGLAMDDCSLRPDCGIQGLVCVDLPQDACPQTPQWACEQRPDCEALRPECDDAPKGGNNGNGEGGEGGGGQPLCEGRADCEADEGCVDGACLPCDVFIGCAEAQ